MEKEIKKLKSLQRRSYFSTIAKSAAGLIVLNSFPLRLFAREKRAENKIKVSIHPLAVKRNRRG